MTDDELRGQIADLFRGRHPILRQTVLNAAGERFDVPERVNQAEVPIMRVVGFDKARDQIQEQIGFETAIVDRDPDSVQFKLADVPAKKRKAFVNWCADEVDRIVAEHA